VEPDPAAAQRLAVRVLELMQDPMPVRPAEPGSQRALQ